MGKWVRIQGTGIADGSQSDMSHYGLSVHRFGFVTELRILESSRFMTDQFGESAAQIARIAITGNPPTIGVLAARRVTAALGK
jgi:hypothetical protein